MSPEMRKLVSQRGAAAQAARGKRFKYDSETGKAARKKQQEEKAQNAGE
jgi:hypothetical protein